MGLFSAIAMLPLAPVRGVAWVAQQVAEEAERELYGDQRIRRELLQARIDHDTGLIDDEEYALRVDDLAGRLAAARRRQAPMTASGSVAVAHDDEEARTHGQ